MRNYFCWLAFFVIILSATLSQAAGPGQDVEAAIEEEFKWLREEAAADFVTVATKTKMTVQEAPSIVSVITGEEIRNMGARNLVDVLRTVPGFDLMQYTYLPLHKIYVRGLTSADTIEKMKMMVNGHTLQDFNLDALPLSNIRRIEIIRGPGSALYGTGAFLGVVNIITKRGGDEPSRISLEYGSHASLRPHGEFSYKKDDLSAYLYADHYTTDGYDGRIGPDMASVDPGIFPSASRRMTAHREHYTFQTDIRFKNVYLSGLVSKQDAENPISITGTLTDEDKLDVLNGYAEIGAKLLVAEKGNVRMRAYYDHDDEKFDLELLPEETGEAYGFPPGQGFHEGLHSKTSMFGGELTLDYEAYPGIQMLGGGSYEVTKLSDTKHHANYNPTGEMDIEVLGITYPPFPYQHFSGGLADISDQANSLRDAEQRVTAFYGQGLLDLKRLFSLKRGVENLSLVMGLRYDHYNTVGSAAVPRFGVIYSPTERVWFKALYGEAFRSPSFVELYLQNSASLGRGNPDLDPERIQTAEGMIGCRLTKTLRGNLTFFHVTSKDLIQFSMEEFAYVNVGRTESAGVEAELRLSFGKHDYAYCNFTWQDVRNTTNATIEGTDQRQGDFFPGSIPEFYGNIGVNYDMTENIIANVSLNYTGERRRSEERMWDAEKGELVPIDLRDPIKARTLVNASLIFRNFVKGLEMQLSGFNLFDSDSRDPDPDGYLEEDMPRPGRTFTGRVSYSF